MIPIMNNCYAAIRLTVKMTDCKRQSGWGSAPLWYVYSNGALCNENDEVFSYCAEKIEGAHLSPLCCSVLKSWDWGEKSRGSLWGENGGRRWGGVRRVKSHLDARDGAEFHEQHLEFQLHHVGQTQQEAAIRGWELVWICLIGFLDYITVTIYSM